MARKYTAVLTVLNLAFPVIIENMLQVLVGFVDTLFVSRLGLVEVAAVTANIEIFSYMPGYGFTTAATILMGQNLGAEKPKEAHHYGKLACYLGAILMSLIGAVYFIFAEALAALFTTDPIVIRQVAVALRIVALVQPALAINLIVAGALQGAGATKFPMYLTTIGVWLIRTIGIYLLAIKAGLGLTGVWLAIALDIIFRAVFLLYRYLSKGYFRAATSIYETLLFKKSGASL
ncbi:MAG: MATE family efflux transporter [Carboxydocellales bacterium]